MRLDSEAESLTSGTRNVQVVLPVEMYRRLRDEAHRQGITMSKIVRDALERKLPR